MPTDPRRTTVSLRGGRPNQDPQAAPKRTSGIRGIVERVLTRNSFTAGDLKAVRMQLATGARAKELAVLRKLLQHPDRDNLFEAGTADKLRDVLDRAKVIVETPAASPTAAPDLTGARTIVRDGYRMVPQADGGVQILFTVGATKRALTVASAGTGLIRVPDDYPDLYDIVALLVATCDPELLAPLRASAYNYLAFVAGKLNPEPIAETLGLLYGHPEDFPADLLPRLIKGLAELDPEASEDFRQLGTNMGLLDATGRPQRPKRPTAPLPYRKP